MSNVEVSLIDFDSKISTKDITLEAASFLMIAVLKDVLIQIPRYEQTVTREYDETTAKQQMVDQLRVFHADNAVQLKDAIPIDAIALTNRHFMCIAVKYYP